MKNALISCHEIVIVKSFSFQVADDTDELLKNEVEDPTVIQPNGSKKGKKNRCLGQINFRVRRDNLM